MESEKVCLACGEIIKGRSDKKFCDDYCRNSYNNKLKSTSNNFMRKVNHILTRNRRILEQLLPPEESMSKASEDKLKSEGYNFKYFTHQYTNKKNQIYFFCYEYGYLPLENNWYLIVKQKDE
ncbi:MAG TPA: hypothetical protein PK076_05585 [Saprospiraceae bacterium]|nr:hypothetical protein [Saprospiraceae bacterium]HQW55575.1 hypothetical protein [Saprospiraceae bacterium]